MSLPPSGTVAVRVDESAGGTTLAVLLAFVWYQPPPTIEEGLVSRCVAVAQTVPEQCRAPLLNLMVCSGTDVLTCELTVRKGWCVKTPVPDHKSRPWHHAVLENVGSSQPQAHWEKRGQSHEWSLNIVDFSRIV